MNRTRSRLRAVTLTAMAVLAMLVPTQRAVAALESGGGCYWSSDAPSPTRVQAINFDLACYRVQARIYWFNGCNSTYYNTYGAHSNSVSEAAAGSCHYFNTKYTRGRSSSGTAYSAWQQY